MHMKKFIIPDNTVRRYGSTRRLDHAERPPPSGRRSSRPAKPSLVVGAPLMYIYIIIVYMDMSPYHILVSAIRTNSCASRHDFVLYEIYLDAKLYST